MERRQIYIWKETPRHYHLLSCLWACRVIFPILSHCSETNFGWCSLKDRATRLALPGPSWCPALMLSSSTVGSTCSTASVFSPRMLPMRGCCIHFLLSPETAIVRRSRLRWSHHSRLTFFTLFFLFLSLMSSCCLHCYFLLVSKCVTSVKNC